VANAILYDIVANVAAIPASPANNDAVEVTDSTGIQSFTPLTGVPAGFVGSSGLSVRLVYTTTGSTWNWIQYFPNDPETRYLKLAGGTLTGDLTVANQGDIRFGEATANGSNYVAIQAPSSLAANVTYTLPSADGTSGQLLSTNGSGALSWATTSNDIIQEGNSSAEVIDTGSDGRFVVTTEGTERLRVDSSGRLGLGASTVDSRFVVRAHSGVSDTPIVKIEHPSNDADFAISGLYDSDGNVTYLGSNLYYNSSYAPARFDTGKPSSAITLSGRTGNGEITFLTGTATASERARIDSSGRLLVGTSSARSNVDTPGGNSTPFVQIETAAGSYSNGLSIINNSVGTFAPIVTLGATNGSSVGSNVIVSNGQYFGTINFVGADGTSLIEGASIRGEVDGTPGANDMPGRLVFSTTADGASSPTERLNLNRNGDARFSNTSIIFPNTDNAVALGAVGNRFTALYAVNGTIQTSDLREKTQITDSILGSAFVKSLRPVSYKWIEGGNSDTGKRDEDGNYIYESVSGQRTHWGFIAQEVKQAVDDAGVDFGGWVLADKDDSDSQQALRYDQFIAPLTKALQEALEKIETLEAKVAALESPTTTLEIPVDPSSTDI
jgi:hypothetical protein